MQPLDDFTVPQAAKFLNVADETVRRHIRAGRLFAEKKGTQWFVAGDNLLKFRDSYDPKTGKLSGSRG